MYAYLQNSTNLIPNAAHKAMPAMVADHQNGQRT